MLHKCDKLKFNMKEYIKLLQKHKQYKEIIHRLSSGKDCCVNGLWGSSANLFIAAAANEKFYSKGLIPSILLVVPGIEEAQEDLEDLKTFSNLSVMLFPAMEDIFHNNDEADEDILAQRLFILNQLRKKNSDDPQRVMIIVAPVQALLQPVLSVKSISDNSLSLQKGREYPREDFIGLLHTHHYHEVSQVENPGEYAIRGGIVDVFPFASETPYRIEYFGDEIESIRSFNMETQQSETQLSSCQILFVHIADNLPSRQREKEKTSFLDHIGRETTIILKEPVGIKNKLRQMLEITTGDEAFFSEEELFKRLDTFTKITLSKLPFSTDNCAYSFSVKAIDEFPRQIQDIVAELKNITEHHEKTIVFCINSAEEQRFREIISDLHAAGKEKLELRLGYISQGFRFTDINIAILAHHEIFHRYKQRHEVKKPVQTRAIDSFLDLKKGDLVVHISHGIGRFLGIEILEDDGCRREYLVLEFDEGTKIYVPATKIELVQKYIGASGYKAKLDKINSRSWEIRKKRTEHAVADVASDLLHIQAMRNAKEGIAYPPDTEWQKEFEAAFIYEETPDQLQVLEAIKSDMQARRPMDRLICGDVGYGKTELAIRAAFKAAMSGKQVAILVPTTILAQQHYTTFSERMADYPVRVEVLSRLKSHKEQKDILEKTLAGTVDILIGTHRLLQKDVVFKDLGLVIIDEEQRFGVAHKERFKKMRKVVDMLTLTATPIPRTLHMSLMGIKDISSLNTPPMGRQSIRTQIIRYDPQRIRQAILLEMNRNGQVYFVHNRVYNIERIARTLAGIVPEAKILTVHGQMDEKLLEQRMRDFVNHKADILVSTTIIESGLDIPNVNTIFINSADSFGLADLHQLRGRVGRHKHHAYAYIILPIDRPITPEAEKRVKAIEEFAELGAGFKIAMRDLEIRGAGNILGVEQHGHIAAVGYEMYCRLLELAVRKARNEPVSEPLDVSFKMNLESFIPNEYIPQYSVKMDIYRRLNRSVTLKEIDDISREMIDRFGNVPRPVKNLLSESELRVIARDSHIRSIVRVNNILIIQVNELKKAENCLSKLKKNIRVINNDTLHLRLPKDGIRSEELLDYLKKSFTGNGLR
ncbi:MAG: transcription-repair coupling factor [Planctomycetes bacterium]|nr:transcription-repair coupling factor [Planctomycetota bacterium]